MFFKKRSWKFWNYTVGSIALILLVIYLITYEINKSRELEIYGDYTIGEIVDFHYRKGNIAVILFTANDSKYRSYYRLGGWESAYIGEKYLVKYSSKNPENNETIMEKPVFTKDQKINITTGFVTKFVSLPGGIEFEYKVKGRSFNKIVHASDSLIEKIKIREKYEVEYLIDTPQIAIIKFDKPFTLGGARQTQ